MKLISERRQSGGLKQHGKREAIGASHRIGYSDGYNWFQLRQTNGHVYQGFGNCANSQMRCNTNYGT